jgi:hypothetical protein
MSGKHVIALGGVVAEKVISRIKFDKGGQDAREQFY